MTGFSGDDHILLLEDCFVLGWVFFLLYLEEVNVIFENRANTAVSLSVNGFSWFGSLDPTAGCCIWREENWSWCNFLRSTWSLETDNRACCALYWLRRLYHSFVCVSSHALFLKEVCMGIQRTNNKNPLWGGGGYWVCVLVLNHCIVYKDFSQGCAYAILCNHPRFSPSFLSLTSL